MIPILPNDLSKRIKTRIFESFGEFHNKKGLVTPDAQKIRAGINGGLPSDSLTTDLFWGCLPATSICYGSCFAAKAAFDKNLDFSKRKQNILDIELLVNDLSLINKNQGFLKNGFNSDPSFNWDFAIQFGEIISKAEMHLVFITKCLKFPKFSQIRDLMSLGIEVRTSISSLDTDRELENRLNFIKTFKEVGGYSVPNLITSIFKYDILNEKQMQIANFIKENDLPACENPLRINKESGMMEFVNRQDVFEVPSNQYGENFDEVFSGALFPDDILIPPYYSLKDTYNGLPSNQISKISLDYIKSIWTYPILSNFDLKNGNVPQRSPRMSLILPTSKLN